MIVRPGLALLGLLMLPLAASAGVLQLPPVDIVGALAADAARPGPQPWRFAVPIPVALGPETHGTWQSLPDGRLRWQLRLRSPGASSLNFGFSVFELPPGAELSVQGANGHDRRGPYQARHAAAGQLWTPVVRAEEALITLDLPGRERPQLRLRLGTVNHGFRGFGARDTFSAKSGDCNIDVVCGDGDGWRDPIRSVARITVAGALLCSGQLVNNTAQDFTPYFLTANHCVPSAALAPTIAFYWNYQTSRCGGTPDGSLEQTQTGSVQVAGSAGGTDLGPDFTLLRLLQAPDPAFGVYYSGWDRRDLAPVGVTGIHHPSGDEKRISHEFGATAIAAYTQEPDSPLSRLQPTHLLVRDWDRGVTEGGSSGSGLWNQQRRLVGQLSGGGSSCEAPDAPDWYGRMAMNFDYLPTPLTSVAFWLDPTGSGAELLDGADPGRAGGGAGAGSGSGSGSSSSDASGGGGSGGLGLAALIAVALRRRRRI